MGYELKLNGVDITEKLHARTLVINRDLREYSASFELTLTPEEVRGDFVFFAMDVQIYDEGKRVFGGLIERVNLISLGGDLVNVKIDVGDYNMLTRRFNIVGDISKDGATAGAIATKYINLFLAEEGVTIGTVEPGAIMIDIEGFEDDLYLKKLSELLDELAQLSGAFYWQIDHNKVFHFYSTEFQATTHTDPELKVRPNSIFSNVQLNQDLVGYSNRYYVIGGQAPVGTPPENIDKNGDILVFAEFPNEILFMKGKNGGTGAWAEVYKNDKIVTLGEAIRVANDLLATNGERPATLNFETMKELFREGDYIFADFPTFFKEEERFVVDKVTIEDIGRQQLLYTYTCSLRSTNVPKSRKLTDLLGKLKGAIPKATPEKNGGGIIAEQFDIQIQNAVTTSVGIEML